MYRVTGLGKLPAIVAHILAIVKPLGKPKAGGKGKSASKGAAAGSEFAEDAALAKLLAASGDGDSGQEGDAAMTMPETGAHARADAGAASSKDSSLDAEFGGDFSSGDDGGGFVADDGDDVLLIDDDDAGVVPAAKRRRLDDGTHSDAGAMPHDASSGAALAPAGGGGADVSGMKRNRADAPAAAMADDWVNAYSAAVDIAAGAEPEKDPVPLSQKRRKAAATAASSTAGAKDGDDVVDAGRSSAAGGAASAASGASSAASVPGSARTSPSSAEAALAAVGGERVTKLIVFAHHKEVLEYLQQALLAHDPPITR